MTVAPVALQWRGGLIPGEGGNWDSAKSENKPGFVTTPSEGENRVPSFLP